MAIECPMCTAPKSDVKDSRPDPRGIRRRRSCRGCGHLFNTWETVTNHQESVHSESKPEIVYRDRVRVKDARQISSRTTRVKELCEEIRMMHHPLEQGVRLARIEQLCDEIKDL